MPPITQKQTRGNQSPFVNKNTIRFLWLEKKVRNKFLKEATPINRSTYKKQKKYCVLLKHKNKNRYHGSLNNMRATRVQHKWKISILVMTGVKTYFHTPILATWQMKVTREKQFHSNNYLLEMPRYHPKMHLKSVPQNNYA